MFLFRTAIFLSTVAMVVAWAPAIRERGATVEIEKPESERGRYQHPELYGQPPQMAVDDRPPPERPEDVD